MNKKQIAFSAVLIIFLNIMAIYFGLKIPESGKVDSFTGMMFFMFSQLSICGDMLAIIFLGVEFYDWLGTK